MKDDVVKRDRRLVIKPPPMPPALSTKRYKRVASTIKPRTVDWLWWPLIPMGAITLVAGRGGVGKGLWVADTVARITTAGKIPLSAEPMLSGNVAWAEMEDEADVTLAPRLIAAGANMTHVAIMDKAEFDTLTGRRVVEDGIRLIVLSPLVSFTDLEDKNKGEQVREALERLRDLVKGTKCAIVGLVHPNKKADLEALQRILGSVEFVNFVRSVVMLMAEDDDTARLVHAKWNWSVKGDDMLFHKVNRQAQDHPRGQYIGIDWERAEGNVDPSTVFDKRKSGSAGEWLVDYLEKHGKSLCSDIFEAGKEAGHGKDALKAAKDRRRKQIGYAQAGGRQNMSWFLRRTT